MKLAFYYHIEVGIIDGQHFTMPGYLGKFIDGLASEVQELILVAHTVFRQEGYSLRASNIRLVDLGKATPAWHRHLFHYSILGELKEKLSDADVLIIRSPSPLAPFFHKYIPDDCLLYYYVVGSYAAGANEMRPRSIREWVTRQYLYLNDQLFRKELKGKDIFVNSPQLKESFISHCRSIKVIPSTTLSEEDFYYRENTCLGNTINLLYTGRFDLQKGLLELVDAFFSISVEYHTMHLHFVGWEDNPLKPVEEALRKRVVELNVQDHVSIHGKKQLGEELWRMYRMADIYVIPSYHEGFPRTIWEAMANSLPVVATSVGAIPYYLSNKVHALLVEPKDFAAIAEAIKLLMETPSLRKQLIGNSIQLVRENTVSNRAKQMVTYVEKGLPAS